MSLGNFLQKTTQILLFTDRLFFLSVCAMICFPLAVHTKNQYNIGMNTLRIGTRGSELALVQTRLVIAALQAQHPELHCEIVTISTPGDQRTDVPLHRVNTITGTGDKGVFIATIEEALAAGDIDCAVHSLKDMPGELDERFSLAAVLPRQDVRDALVIKPGADMYAPLIATGSVRRTQLVQTRWEGRARTVAVRGNVATRLRKLVESPEVSATLLARAGLNRLGYSDSIVVQGTTLTVQNLPIDEFPPALGQGAIAVETRRNDAATTELCATINHAPTRRCIDCERAFLAQLKADCSVPVGGNASCDAAGNLHFLLVYYTPAGKRIELEQSFSPATTAEAIATFMHQELLRQL